MKRTIVLALVSASVCVGLLSLAPGCGTTPQAKSAQAENAFVTSVDIAMQTWVNYVKANQVPQTKIDAVKKAYITYYNAQLVAKSVLETWVASGSSTNADWSTANASLVQAESAVINIINLYTKGQ